MSGQEKTRQDATSAPSSASAGPPTPVVPPLESSPTSNRIRRRKSSELTVEQLHLSISNAAAAVGSSRNLWLSKQNPDDSDPTKTGKSKTSYQLRLGGFSAPKKFSPRTASAPLPHSPLPPGRKREDNMGGNILNHHMSIEKYIHRVSTAAEDFHQAEMDWLQNEALGYSPLLEELAATQREDGTPERAFVMREGSCDSDEDQDSFVEQIDEDDILRHLHGYQDMQASSQSSSPSFRPDSGSASPESPLLSPVSAESPSPGMKKLHVDEMVIHRNNLSMQEGISIHKPHDMRRITSIFAARRRAKYMRKRRDTEPAELEGRDIHHEFKSLLTKDNALEYRKKNIVKAFRTESPVSFVKDWGVSKGNPGDFIVWNKPGDLYAISADEFLKNYIPRHTVHTDGIHSDDEYIKKTTVLARRIGYPFILPHAKSGEISEGMRGDYVIQPENGKVEDQYIVFAEKFLERYIIVGSFSEYTQMLKGVIMVPPSKELKRANSSAGAKMHLTSERNKVSALMFQTDTVLQLLQGAQFERSVDAKLNKTKDPSQGGFTLSEQESKKSGESETRPASPAILGQIAALSATENIPTDDFVGERREHRSQQDLPEPKGILPETHGVMSWDFDIFSLSHESRHWPLFHLAHHIFFERLNIVDKLGINGNLFCDFLAEVDDAYLPVAYHNSLHGADVLHGCFVMNARTTLSQHITSGELFSFLVAAMCHDLSHPGTNNMFQIDSQSQIALKYNDVSVLENFHIGVTFELLSKDKYAEMFPQISDEDERKDVETLNATLFRKIVIQTILATDLAERERYYRDWDYRVLKKRNLNLATHHIDRLLYMKMIIKCCDLKHPSLKREAHLKWSAMVNEEFIQQAFKEDELGEHLIISFLCSFKMILFVFATRIAADTYSYPCWTTCLSTGLPHRCPTTREPVAVAKSQAGFIRFLVLPTFERFCAHVNSEFGNFLVQRLKVQISFWNEARRLAEFRRGGRSVMVINRLRRLSSRGKKAALEESGTNKKSPELLASTQNATDNADAEYVGEDSAMEPIFATLRSETLLSDPGDVQTQDTKIDDRRMAEKGSINSMSAPHSLSYTNHSNTHLQ